MREPKRPGRAGPGDEDVTEVPGHFQPAGSESSTAPGWPNPPAPEPVPLWESLEPTPAMQPPPKAAPREPERLVPTPGQLLARRYTVLEVLGQGGMGLVVAAFDSKLDRRVALKVLSPEYSGEVASTRLLREAQAMARLNHPNVVQVYDTGRLQDRSLFIAMEYVQGQTLRRWCHEDPGARSWREVLQAYVAAGRGLAAAHAAGVIHRDFKPDNVLVGHDGRVKVTDFGLARAEQEPAEPTAALSPDTSMPLAAWELQLTRPGIVMGTPRYMAPELTRGQPADERSDIFAFCVSLYEALYQQMAFPGERQAERMQAHAEGRVNPPPANSPVPARVARAVLQGLRADPLQRPPSMESLLRVLEYDPAVRRRAGLQVAAVAGVVAALGGLALLGWLRRPGAVCEGTELRLAGVWDEAVQQQMRQAFLGTGLPYAEDTWWRVAGPLQSYANAWVERRVAACEASQGAAGQPRDLALLEVDCLERRRSQFAALTELLSRSMDQELLSKAVQAARALPTLESCADVRALVTAVPLPQEPTLRQRVEELLRQVDRLEALEGAGKYRQGLELSRELLPQVEQVEYAPLRARALYLSALLSFGDGDYKGTEALLRQVLPVAAQAADDELLAQAWSLLVRAVGGKQSRHAEALGMQLAMETAVERAKSDLARASALNSLGSVLADMGRFEESRGYYERALTLSEKALGPEHLLVAVALSNLGNMLREVGLYEQALKHHQRALAIREKVLGPEHPLVANSLGNVANGLSALGRREEALALYERTLTTQERTLGPNHPYVATSLNNLGTLLKELGRYEEALQHHERALARVEQVLGPEHRDLVVTLINLGESLASLERYEEARAHYERALAVADKALGLEHPLVGYVLDNQGTLMLRLGRYEEARWNYERALALRRKALGSEHPEVGATLSNQGHLALELGACREAAQLQDRARALFERALGPKHPSLATAMGRLGRAQVCAGELDLAGHHLERARALLERALGPRHLELSEPLLGLGELELARGHPERALPHLERALELAPPADRPEVQLALARALQATKAGPQRARELATEALEHYQQVGHRKRAAEASRWLAAQGAR